MRAGLAERSARRCEEMRRRAKLRQTRRSRQGQTKSDKALVLRMDEYIRQQQEDMRIEREYTRLHGCGTSWVQIAEHDRMTPSVSADITKECRYRFNPENRFCDIGIRIK